MAAGARSDPPADVHEAFYHRHLSALVQLGTSECGLSRRDARNLAHEVLVASLGNTARIPNLDAWLTATMRSAALTHQRITNARRR
jgi:DNA-directed RNA polymerase specialized sigma24 family protein